MLTVSARAKQKVRGVKPSGRPRGLSLRQVLAALQVPVKLNISRRQVGTPPVDKPFPPCKR